MMQPSAPLRFDSPCINVCVLDVGSVCVGCGRHVDEIASWPRMTAVERYEANLRAEARRARRK